MWLCLSGCSCCLCSYGPSGCPSVRCPAAVSPAGVLIWRAGPEPPEYRGGVNRSTRTCRYMSKWEHILLIIIKGTLNCRSIIPRLLNFRDINLSRLGNKGNSGSFPSDLVDMTVVTGAMQRQKQYELGKENGFAWGGHRQMLSPVYVHRLHNDLMKLSLTDWSETCTPEASWGSLCSAPAVTKHQSCCCWVNVLLQPCQAFLM